MSSPNIDLESAAHEASRSHPTRNFRAFGFAKPTQRDIQIDIVSKGLPLVFLVLFVAAATIVLVFTFNQHLVIPSHIMIGLAATIGIVLLLWCGLASYLYYEGRITCGLFRCLLAEVRCSSRQEQRVAHVETVMARTNDGTCEAEEMESSQTRPAGISEGILLPGIKNKSRSEPKGKGIRQPAPDASPQGPEGSWPDQIQKPEPVATALRAHDRQSVTEEARLSVGNPNSRIPKERRVPDAPKYGLASYQSSRTENRAVRSPYQNRPSIVPETGHDQQSPSGDVAQGKDEPGNRHQLETSGSSEAIIANPVVDPEERPSEDAHSKVENGLDISQITNKSDGRQHARQAHIDYVKVEGPMSPLPRIPQRASARVQAPRAQLKTPLAGLKGNHQPHYPQGPLSTIFDDLSSPTSSDSSISAQKLPPFSPAPASHEPHTPRSSQDDGIVSSKYEAPSLKASKLPVHRNTGQPKPPKMRESTDLPLLDPTGNFKVRSGPVPKETRRKHHAKELVNEEDGMGWNQQQHHGTAVQEAHVEHATHAVSTDTFIRRLLSSGRSVLDISSRGQPNSAVKGPHSLDEMRARRRSCVESDKTTFLTASPQQRTHPLPDPTPAPDLHPHLDSHTKLSPLPSTLPAPPSIFPSISKKPRLTSSNKARNQRDSSSQTRAYHQTSQALFVETCERFQKRLDAGTEAWREVRRRERLGFGAVVAAGEDGDGEGEGKDAGDDGVETRTARGEEGCI